MRISATENISPNSVKDDSWSETTGKSLQLYLEFFRKTIYCDCFNALSMTDQMIVLGILSLPLLAIIAAFPLEIATKRKFLIAGCVIIVIFSLVIFMPVWLSGRARPW